MNRCAFARFAFAALRWVAALALIEHFSGAAAAQGTEFYTLRPCRVFDTRRTDGPRGGPPLAAGSIRQFEVGGYCGVPQAATAVVANLTVVQPTGAGHITVYPGDIAPPPAISTLNFAAGATRANNAVLGLGVDGSSSIRVLPVVASGGRADLILDVSGYFRAACPESSGSPPPSSVAESCTAADSSCTGQLDFGGCKVDYLRTHSLDVENTAIERAVIAVHGTGGNYAAQFSTVIDVVADAGQLDSVLVIAPLFPAAGSQPADRLGWFGYQRGEAGTCTANTSVTVSSFSVGDALVDLLAGASRFPNLRDIVVIGHSGGGQFSGRYGATTVAVGRYPCIRFKFVPTNPSSWIFLDGKRYIEDAGWTSSGPAFDACPWYNEYRYGLDALSGKAYVGNFTPEEVRDNWRNRNIVYFAGEADTCTPDPADPSSQCNDIDKSCAAMLQGSHRLERATRFFESVTLFYPPLAGAVHEFSTVPGVGHSSSGMYRSTAGRRHILE